MNGTDCLTYSWAGGGLSETNRMSTLTAYVLEEMPDVNNYVEEIHTTSNMTLQVISCHIDEIKQALLHLLKCYLWR